MAAIPQTQPWYAGGLCFSCTRCGNCCTGPPGYVWVSEAEIAGLAAALGMSVEKFRLRHTRRIGSRTSLLEHGNGDCEFLTRDAAGRATCTVHAARPLQCRTWPFWESNLRSARTWELASRNCPGMNQGPRHALPVIQDALRQARAANLDL